MDKTPDLIAHLKEGDDRTIRELYLNQKKGFFLFAKRYKLDDDEILDIYQDAIIALCDNAKRGKIDHLQGEVSTYLFAIGKFMIYKKIKLQNKTISMSEYDPDEVSGFSLEDEEDHPQLHMMGESLKKLGEQCQRVLYLFYYEEKKLDEIQTILSYSSKDVLKAQKSRCLKQLREIIQGRKDG